jgi:GH15 family glucan-1,4-alpha-glucosidase
MPSTNNYLPIKDYGIVGNLHTTALISIRGSVDFFPFTRFDSPTVFGSLLDIEKGGFFRIDEINHDHVNYKQLYLPDTAVLLTRYLTEGGIAELTDFMPIMKDEYNCALVRNLKVIKGEHTFRITLQPRFEYGAYGFITEKQKSGLLIKSKGKEKTAFRLLSDIEFKNEADSLVAEITLRSKDEVNIIIEAIGERLLHIEKDPMKFYTAKAFGETVDFWRNWISKSNFHGRWQEIVNRSAITLKLLTSSRYGSTVAAATFGLPEQIGGDRNWDYRYTWIRDAAFTMYAFLRLGYTEEAQQFIQWIIQRSIDIDDASELNLMYRVDGSSDLDEKELFHMEGYKKSKPVRIGNGAYNQFQLDIYGELIDTIYIYNKNGEPITYEFWLNLIKFIDFVCNNWQVQDRGIWEVRNDKREFLLSKIMSWVALDRGINIAESRSFPAPLEKWRRVRDEIFTDVYENYWNHKKKAFVQYRGADILDASALLIPLVRMLSPKEPRWISTLKAIEKELVTDSLVYRYRLDEGASDGFTGEEGTFSMCSFWYIESLAKAGELDRAVLYFEKMLGYANHLGLFSEQISVKGDLLGNFPQAFTHLGLISAAYQLKLLMDNDETLE